jgi:CheY-like chemotaxis protein
VIDNSRAVRVMVLDDDPLWRRIIVHTLAKQDVHAIEIVEVSTVEAAVTAIDREPFDLVLLDYELPDGYGLDLLDRCDRNRMQRMVLITGFADHQDLDDERANHVDGYLTKPFLSSDLTACLWGLEPRSSRSELNELNELTGLSALSVLSELGALAPAG